MIPWLTLVIAAIAVLFVLTRKHMTYKKEGAGVLLFITVVVAGLIGWYLDVRTGYTTLIEWGMTAGGIAGIGTWTALIGAVVAVLGMGSSAYRSGQFVS